MASLLSSFDPDTTLGALQIGVNISIALFGTLCLQTYLYYSNFPKDPLHLKSLVSFIWICALGHTICVSKSLYQYTVTNYGHIERILKAPVALCVAILLSGLLDGSVQIYFALRLRLLTNTILIPAFCGILSILRVALNIVGFVTALRMQTLIQFENDSSWLITSILSVGAANDLTLAGTLVWCLVRRRKQAQGRNTVMIIDKMIVWTIETGLLSALGGLIMLILFLTMRYNYYWLAVFVFLAELFANSLMAVLNARVALRDLKPDVIEFSSVGFASSPQQQINIELTQNVVVTTDNLRDHHGTAAKWPDKIHQRI